MTENEIIKALERCSIDYNCGDCPYYYKDEGCCPDMLMNDALDLINRQKSEIEELQHKRNGRRKTKMTERERLIQMIDKALDKHDSTIENYVHPEQEWIADYLLSNGVIVPPCKVGDTVYSYDENLHALLDYRINQITLSDGAPTLYSGLCFKEDELLSDIDFVESDVGKTVFLNREEAEKALKERENND